MTVPRVPSPTLADLVAQARASLTEMRGYPTQDVRDGHSSTGWRPDPIGAYVGFEDALDVVAAALRAALAESPAPQEEPTRE